MWRCKPGTTRSLGLRVSGQGLHLASKDLVDFVPECHCHLLVVAATQEQAVEPTEEGRASERPDRA